MTKNQKIISKALAWTCSIGLVLCIGIAYFPVENPDLVVFPRRRRKVFSIMTKAHGIHCGTMIEFIDLTIFQIEDASEVIDTTGN